MRSNGKNRDLVRNEEGSGFVCRAWSYLEADVAAALPHHLQLTGLPVAPLPQFQPHLIVNVKQVMGVISGIVEHFLGQRSRIATEEMISLTPPRSSNLLCLLCGR